LQKIPRSIFRILAKNSSTALLSVRKIYCIFKESTRWHTMDLGRSVKSSGAPSRGILISGKKITSADVNRFARLARRVESQEKKRKWGHCAAILVETDASYHVAVAIKERKEGKRNATTYPRAIVRYACRLLNDSIERVTSVVSMKIPSDESRDEKPLKEFLHGKVRRNFITFIIKEIKKLKHRAKMSSTSFFPQKLKLTYNVSIIFFYIKIT